MRSTDPRGILGGEDVLFQTTGHIIQRRVLGLVRKMARSSLPSRLYQ